MSDEEEVPEEEGEMPILEDDVLEEDIPVVVDDELGFVEDLTEDDEADLMLEEDPDGNY